MSMAGAPAERQPTRVYSAFVGSIVARPDDGHRRVVTASACRTVRAPGAFRARSCAQPASAISPFLDAKAGPRVSRAAGPQFTPEPGFGPRFTVDEMLQTLQGHPDPIWEIMRREAEYAASQEPQLASGLYTTILVHDTLEDTLATVLSNALDNPSFQATQWIELFRDGLGADAAYGRAVRADISAIMERDPAMSHAACVLLFAKGFHALEAFRLSNWLWRSGRGSLALYLQSMISSRFAVDIHPAAQIGSGVLFDHGTGIVIGETAILGNNVSILQNVTLGGTGKESGDRHPKVGDGVMIGAGATILGNITIGMGAHIAACSVVLKPVEAFSIVSGVPAKVVGKVTYTKDEGVFPSFVMDQRLSIEVIGSANPYQNTVTGTSKRYSVEGPQGGEGENI
jgi:serine O-acetyltransferase